MEEVIGYPVEGIIPNAFLKVSAAADDGHMALDLDPDSTFAQRVNFLAKKIINYKQDDSDDF